MAVTLRYFTEFGKHTFQHITAASICGGIYAGVYCILYHVCDVVVKKVYVRYLISWWVSCYIYEQNYYLVILQLLCYCCAEVDATTGVTISDFPTVTFTIHLRRNPIYYVINLIVPCGLMSFVAVATFILQPGCAERLGLGEYCFTRIFWAKVVSPALNTLMSVA